MKIISALQDKKQITGFIGQLQAAFLFDLNMLSGQEKSKKDTGHNKGPELKNVVFFGLA